ncbi:WD40/YVTN/BNR-like repeat-containing protein [Niabella soli]|uniref:Oxidoreductase n=1 Tax=Niabella soli DSM 19437 TaxID=929713 RepID=W0EXW3_9BACT|nr:oxidoreductase [Niabella soli]AHF14403.1 oxidoreductase [Niabella soli DSM 19437]
MFRQVTIALLLIFSTYAAKSQTLKILSQGTSTNPRGIGIYKNVIWLSGSSGYTGRSADNGATWQWQQVPGYEANDFRDIQVLNEHTALIMAIASPAYILKTTDAGKSWKKVYENKDTAMFLDAMAFADNKHGYVIGDPVKGHLFIAATHNAGDSWEASNRFNFPALAKGEAFFAASGTNIAVEGRQVLLASGGTQSRLFAAGKTTALPIAQGTPTAGANGMGILNKKIMIAGGDFSQPAKKDSALIYSEDEGKTWKLPEIAPAGYRSAVGAIDENTWITCGLTGVDISKDGGKTWQAVSTEGFNALCIDRPRRIVFLAGPRGKVGRIDF